jgi:hypothetical protein
MDLTLLPDLQNHTQLAAWLTGTLPAYLGHLGKGLLEKLESSAEKSVAEAICNKAKALFGKIRGQVSDDAHAGQILQQYEKEPENQPAGLEAILMEIKELYGLLTQLATMQGTGGITYAAPSIGNVSGGSTVTQIQGNGNSVQ